MAKRCLCEHCPRRFVDLLAAFRHSKKVHGKSAKLVRELRDESAALSRQLEDLRRRVMDAARG